MQTVWGFYQYVPSCLNISLSSLRVNRCKNGETRSLFTLFSFVFVTSFHQQSPCYFQTQETRLIIYEYEISHTTWVLHLFLYSVHWHHNYHSDSNYWCCVSNYCCCYYIEFVSAVQYCVEKLYLMQSLIL